MDAARQSEAGPARALVFRTCTVLGLAMAACTRPGGSPTEAASAVPPLLSPHIRQVTVERLFAEAGSHMTVQGSREVVAFTCAVVEGAACWFGADPEAGSMVGGLSRQVMDDLGEPAVEGASRSQVTVSCSREAGVGSALRCVADWGWGGGWEPLSVG